MPPRNKISIYAGEPITKALQHCDNRSQRINAIAERYLYLCRVSVPTLTVPEWSYLIDVLNGHCAEPIELSARSIGLMVRDAAPDGLPEKWGVEAAQLAAKMEALPVAGGVAVLELAEQFWAENGSTPVVIGEWLTERLGRRLVTGAGAKK